MTISIGGEYYTKPAAICVLVTLILFSAWELFLVIGMILRRHLQPLKARSPKFLAISVITIEAWTLLSSLRVILGRENIPCPVYMLLYIIFFPMYSVQLLLRAFRLVLIFYQNRFKSLLSSGKINPQKRRRTRIFSENYSSTISNQVHSKATSSTYFPPLRPYSPTYNHHHRHHHPRQHHRYHPLPSITIQHRIHRLLLLNRFPLIFASSSVPGTWHPRDRSWTTVPSIARCGTSCI
eukprot:gb/GECH01007862.1/.p1 GENE.gb/GECH01007862.1/~~gb/GECH01007862.1/.p1  ORF type:complete len:237 (+),score=31.18 gb/GECH01007862.1/:1-711(+)